MGRALRSLLVVVSAVVLLAGDVRTADLAQDAVQAASGVAVTVGKALSELPPGAPRPVSQTGSMALLVLVGGIVAASSLETGLVGRRMRRIGDAGDDWRCLLEGAPPPSA